MENKNQIVHCKIEPYDIYIGRGSIWGNPFSHKEGTKANHIVSTREEAVDKYYDYLISNYKLISQIHTLENKVLGCWCKTPKNRDIGCHGDILIYVQKFLKDKKPIYTFASNEAGRHGAGSAKIALEQWGARYKIGLGLVGDSYAIPTKDGNIKTLPLSKIKEYIDRFIDFANNNPKYGFLTVRIGCGLAGFQETEIAPLFKNAGDNILLPPNWRKSE